MLTQRHTQLLRLVAVLHILLDQCHVATELAGCCDIRHRIGAHHLGQHIGAGDTLGLAGDRVDGDALPAAVLILLRCQHADAFGGNAAEYLRAVGGDDELCAWERAQQIVQHSLLPRRMEMKIDFVDQHDARSQQGGCAKGGKIQILCRLIEPLRIELSKLLQKNLDSLAVRQIEKTMQMAIPDCHSTSKIHGQRQHALVTLTELTDLKRSRPHLCIHNELVLAIEAGVAVVPT
ncbi:hypothetical protein D3C78_818480 [compost metagenome]